MTGLLDEAPVQRAAMSERAVLAAALRSESFLRQAMQMLSDDDFYPAQHRELWGIMRGLADSGVAVEPGAVMIEAHKAEHADLVRQVVVSLVGSPLAAGSDGYHLEQIERAAIGRRLAEAIQRAWQRAGESEAEPVTVAEDTIAELRVVQRMRNSHATEVDYRQLVQRTVRGEDMVIPGLLAAGNRVIITAPEGWGKSSLLRQIAGCTAGGLHPFQNVGIRPRRVLVVDAENPQDINTVEYQRLDSFLDVIGHTPGPGMLMVEECGPTNLLDSRVAAERIAQAERVKPDLIIIGPLYQLHEENPNDEGPARKLAAVLDRIRAAAGAAMVIEAHSPHSDGPGGVMLRPFGASLWKRWPEFGYCLHPDLPRGGSDEQMREAAAARLSKFTAWRGPRAVREWPSRLRAGRRLPWEAQ